MNKRSNKDFAFKQWKENRTTKRQPFRYAVYILLISAYLLSIPSQLFSDPTSTVILDEKGQLLGARIADDGQWRFQELDSVPEKFATCLVHFEDRRFYWHFGVSASGVLRAFKQNLNAGKTVSGGSTLTMQLVRLMRKNPPRTYFEKGLEMLLATRIELGNSKEEILRLYASHAPFGNNVVGLNAAAWRYFNRSPEELSWAEAATLAVLPNAPGLIYPGKNESLLLAKRNRLLKALFDSGKIDQTTYSLSLEEYIPNKPLPLPNFAPHLLDREIRNGNKGKTIRTTISFSLQQRLNKLLQIKTIEWEEKHIHNAAVIVVEVKTGHIKSYIGNTANEEEHAPWVDCARAPRSSGSILKPLLFAAALDDGCITPSSILPDYPSNFGSFSPKNFSGQFEGAISADLAVARSLNIPMVHLLNEYGVKKFHTKLKKLGLQSVNRGASHYGLSLILGGAEVRPDQIATTYLSFVRQLSGLPPSGISTDGSKFTMAPENLFSNAALYQMSEAMTAVNRPDEDNNWRLFSSSGKIAWKTGTSFGFRDAWAIGYNPDYVVAVWVGNADGEGRPGLTGFRVAAPVLFSIFNQLPRSTRWFKNPYNDFRPLEVCEKSGYAAGKNCPNKKITLVPLRSLHLESCSYHQVIQLDKTQQYRVNSSCENVFNMVQKKWFVLPSKMEKYYKLRHPEYQVLPSFRDDCQVESGKQTLSIIYPRNNQHIYLPRDLNGETEPLIAEVYHRQQETKVFWHLDKKYIGETTEIHQQSLTLSPGKHELTCIDSHGNRSKISFVTTSKSQ
ncbi:MAG: penicillin-binding protein [Bacteroidota bacterium]|jgi:penicillin-binding protein 1C